ncbi:WapI family immunity protein [Hymenobacter sp. B1770]|uniref:WapI family immunity protein n=1 Tax=Hymenobacter sp. B1770 TaxID=1718788 RepID=UPI003CEE0A34
MLFSGVPGRVVELAVRGYAHAFAAGEDWDNNWLRVFLRACSDQGTWQVEVPCLF